MARTRRADNTGSSWPGASEITDYSNSWDFDVGGDAVVPMLSDEATTYCIVVGAEDPLCVMLDTREQPSPSQGFIHWPSTEEVSIERPSGNPIDHHSIRISNCNGPDLGQRAWSIVWSEEYTQDDHDIWGAQVSWDGQVVTPAFPIDTSPADERHPSVSSPLHQLTPAGAHPYMVTYQRDNSQAGQGTDIMGRVMAWGTPMTLPTNLTQLEGGIHLHKPQLTPDVDTDGTSFLVAYTEIFAEGSWDLDTWASGFDLVGNVIAPTGLADLRMSLGYTPSMEWRPRVTSVQSGTDGLPANPHRFMAVWQNLDFQAGGSGVEGALLDLGQ